MRYIALSVLLVGCATSNVIPYGPDTYVVTSDDASGTASRGRVEARAMQAGADYCAKMGKRMQVAKLEGAGNIWTGTSAKVIFSCVDNK